ncbi:hypothetical protein ACFE04_025955 [Oxalis oulophora]
MASFWVVLVLTVFVIAQVNARVLQPSDINPNGVQNDETELHAGNLLAAESPSSLGDKKNFIYGGMGGFAGIGGVGMMPMIGTGLGGNGNYGGVGAIGGVGGGVGAVGGGLGSNGIPIHD